MSSQPVFNAALKRLATQKEKQQKDDEFQSDDENEEKERKQSDTKDKSQFDKKKRRESKKHSSKNFLKVPSTNVIPLKRMSQQRLSMSRVRDLEIASQLVGTQSIERVRRISEVIEKCRDLLEKRSVQQKKKQGLFYPESDLLLIWKMIMLIFIWYTCLYSPFKIFFNVNSNDSNKFYYLDKLVEFIFFLDIIIKLNTAYQDSEGNIIDIRKEIIRNYFHQGLILDILQILPFELIGIAYPVLNDFPITTTSYSEIIRICRLPQIFNQVTVVQKVFEYFKINSTIQRLIRFIFAVFFSVHICGCLWTFLGRIQYDIRTTWISNMKIDNEDSTRVYLFSIYWCLQTLATVGFGDVHSNNDAEVVFALLWMVIGAGVYSFAIGQLSKMFTDSESRSAKLRNATHIMDEFCEQAGLSNHIKDKIRKALQYSTNKSILSSSEKEDFFDSIPMRLKTRLAEGMFKGNITAVPFLKSKDSIFLANLLPMLQPLKLNKGDFVYRKDQFPNLVYFLIDGRVNFIVGTNQMTFKSYLAGSYFGEIEIFNQTLRSFSVRCEVGCEFLTLDREYLAELLEKFPNVESEMIEMVQQRQEQMNQSLKKIELLLDLKETDNFWKGKETLTFAEIIGQRKKSQLLINHVDSKEKGETNEKESNNPKFHNSMSIQYQKVNTINPLDTITPLHQPTPYDKSQTHHQFDEIHSRPQDMDLSLSSNLISKQDSLKNPVIKNEKNGYHNNQASNSSENFFKNMNSSQNNQNNSSAKDFQSSLNLSQHSDTNIKNHVVLNVFNENQQSMLTEIYEELQPPSAAVKTLNPLHQMNQIESKSINRIQKKYGTGTLDCIEEKNSQRDFENLSNSASQVPQKDDISMKSLGSAFKEPSQYLKTNNVPPIPIEDHQQTFLPSLGVYPRKSYKTNTLYHKKTENNIIKKSISFQVSDDSNLNETSQIRRSQTSKLKTRRMSKSLQLERSATVLPKIKNQNSPNQEDEALHFFDIQNSLKDIVMIDSSSDEQFSNGSKESDQNTKQKREPTFLQRSLSKKEISDDFDLKSLDKNNLSAQSKGSTFKKQLINQPSKENQKINEEVGNSSNQDPKIHQSMKEIQGSEQDKHMKEEQQQFSQINKEIEENDKDQALMKGIQKQEEQIKCQSNDINSSILKEKKSLQKEVTSHHQQLKDKTVILSSFQKQSEGSSPHLKDLDKDKVELEQLNKDSDKQISSNSILKNQNQNLKKNLSKDLEKGEEQQKSKIQYENKSKHHKHKVTHNSDKQNIQNQDKDTTSLDKEVNRHIEDKISKESTQLRKSVNRHISFKKRRTFNKKLFLKKYCLLKDKVKSVSSELEIMTNQIEFLASKYKKVVEIAQQMQKEIADLNALETKRNQLRLKNFKILPFNGIKREISHSILSEKDFFDMEELLSEVVPKSDQNLLKLRLKTDNNYQSFQNSNVNTIPLE